jgi:copper(I)-binding protein
MSIEIRHPWARMQTADSGEAAGFVTLTNRGPEADRLVAASSPLAARTEIWGIKVAGAVLRMRPLENGLQLPVEMAIELKPRGYHLFFRGLAKPLLRGQKVPVTLRFAKAERQQVELVVEAEGYINKDALGLPEPQAPSDNAEKEVQAG